MAGSEVRDFLTCPICLDTFTNPTSLSCHHSFCHSCLLQHWARDSRRNCPVCYRRSSKDYPGVDFALKELSNSFRHKLYLSDPSEQQQQVPADGGQERGEDGELFLNRSLEELEKQLKTHTYHTALTPSPEPLPPPPTGLLLNQVILDPNTANPWLCLSEDLSRVMCRDTFQQLPDSPERFSKYPIVLGSEGYSSGTHQWDLEVGDLPEWSIGVAKEPVDRKGEIFVSP